ncbi:viral a-type inclusion protein [Lasius niger]|uniref:Viral a-type inclusion protein n=1 Tax=Lasius niger TaxID=67767 RepID=A0A0J7KLC4_LASNI|nr:viral a-type inclusion protein [Lasius niger]
MTQWTQPRQSTKAAKPLQRLKAGSIPTLMLSLVKKRQNISDNDITITSKRIKVQENNNISSNFDLQCNETEAPGRSERGEKNEEKEKELIETEQVNTEAGHIIKQINHEVENDNHALETLSQLLSRLKQKNEELLKENKELKKKNKQLNTEIGQLEKKWK